MQTGYWIAIGLFLLGIILFFYLSTRKNYRDQSAAPNYDKLKNESINHYKEKRDKLSLRKIKKVEFYEPEESGFNPFVLVHGIIVLAISLFVGTTVLGTMQDTINETSVEYNVTTGLTEMMSQVRSSIPIIFILMFYGIILFIIYRVFYFSGGGL